MCCVFSERPLARLDSSSATHLSRNSGDRAAVVSSRSRSRSRSRSSRASGRFGCAGALRGMQEAEIQAASHRLEAVGVSARQLRAVTALLGGYARRKADDIAAATHSDSVRAIFIAASPAVSTGVIPAETCFRSSSVVCGLL